MTLKDKDLDVIRKKLESFVSSTVKEGMKVLVQKGPFSGIEANVIMAEDETFYISVEMRSLRLIIGVPKNAVKPLKK